jgi:cell division protein ZapA
MAKEKHTVKVNIFGGEYPIKSEADPEYIKRVAKYVDRKMREISEKVDIRATAKVAILAALNITDELFREKDDKDKRLSEVEDRTAELAEWLEKALHTF